MVVKGLMSLCRSFFLQLKTKSLLEIPKVWFLHVKFLVKVI